MNDFTSGPWAFVLPGLIALAVVFALIIWFFVNRASVRANDKIQLLEALLREQKKQNALLKRLVEYHMPEEPEVVNEPKVTVAEGSEYLQFVPER